MTPTPVSQSQTASTGRLTVLRAEELLVPASEVGLTSGLPCGAVALEGRFLVEIHRDWWTQTQRLLRKIALFGKAEPKRKTISDASRVAE